MMCCLLSFGELVPAPSCPHFPANQCVGGSCPLVLNLCSLWEPCLELQKKIHQSLEPRRLWGQKVNIALAISAGPCWIPLPTLVCSLGGKQRSHPRARRKTDAGPPQSDTWRRRLLPSPASACSWRHEVPRCPAAPHPAPHSWGICSTVSPLCVCLSVCACWEVFSFGSLMVCSGS